MGVLSFFSLFFFRLSEGASLVIHPNIYLEMGCHCREGSFRLGVLPPFFFLFSYPFVDFPNLQCVYQYSFTGLHHLSSLSLVDMLQATGGGFSS
jgi:hypothetical protein